MRRRAAAVLLALGVTVVAASLSTNASGAGDQAQIAVFSYDGSCSGFLLETLSGAVTGCRTIPADVQGGNWSIAADGSMVGGGAGGVAGGPPVTLVRPNDSHLVLDSNVNDFAPAISPDGSKVAFARAEPGNGQHGPSDIWIMNSDGTGLKEIAQGNGSSLRAPTFSPDGKTIAYSCQPGSGGQGCGPLPDGSFRPFGTLLMSTDGSNKRLILINQYTEDLSWSADGTEIATESVAPCACANTPDNTEIFVYHTDGSDLFNGGDQTQNLYPVPSLKVTHEKDVYGAMEPQFLAGSSDQLVYYRAVDDNGGDWGYDYSINVDGSGRQELSLSNEGADYGLIIPAATGGGPPASVNVMHVKVPAVAKLKIAAAKLKIQSVGLTVGTIKGVYSALPKNTVLSQSPAGGTYAHRVRRKGPPVSLTLSLGPAHG